MEQYAEHLTEAASLERITQMKPNLQFRNSIPLQIPSR
jgi:hypothetical protein